MRAKNITTAKSNSKSFHAFLSAAILLFITSSGIPVDAYNVKFTALAETTYDPVDPKNVIVYAGPTNGDIDLGTITLSFSMQEVGTDYTTVFALGKKEAAKVGATAYKYVSSTIYKDTEEIASETFHIWRNEPRLIRIEQSLARDQEKARQAQDRADFEQLLAEYVRTIGETDVGRLIINIEFDFDHLPREERAKRLGCVIKSVTSPTGSKKLRWFNSATKSEVSDSERRRKTELYAIKQVMTQQPELYKASYAELIRINDNFTVRDHRIPVIQWIEPLPSLPADPQTSKPTTTHVDPSQN